MLKIFSVLLVSTLAAAGLANAQTLQEGQIQAFIVDGDVSLLNSATGESQPLTRGTIFGGGYTVQTGPESSVLLLFSNGSSINLQQDSSLDISQFLQAPFDEAQGSFLTLQADPSQSETRMMLNYGELIGEVKKLRAESSYEIYTPSGKAEILGTTFLVSYNPDSGNTVFMNLNGTVVASVAGEIINIPAGQTYAVEGTINEQGTLVVNAATLRPATNDEVAAANDQSPDAVVTGNEGGEGGVPDAGPGGDEGGETTPVTDVSVVTVSPI